MVLKCFASIQLRRRGNKIFFLENYNLLSSKFSLLSPGCQIFANANMLMVLTAFTPLKFPLARPNFKKYYPFRWAVIQLWYIILSFLNFKCRIWHCISLFLIYEKKKVICLSNECNFQFFCQLIYLWWDWLYFLWKSVI